VNAVSQGSCPLTLWGVIVNDFFGRYKGGRDACWYRIDRLIQENENSTVYTVVIELQFKCKRDPTTSHIEGGLTSWKGCLKWLADEVILQSKRPATIFTPSI